MPGARGARHRFVSLVPDGATALGGDAALGRRSEDARLDAALHDAFGLFGRGRAHLAAAVSIQDRVARDQIRCVERAAGGELEVDDVYVAHRAERAAGL